MTREPVISVGGCATRLPHRLIDEKVWVREYGEELVGVHLDPAHGPLEVTRHPKSTKGKPQLVDEHYPPDHPAGQRAPRRATRRRPAFLALGDGARQWLIEACAGGVARVGSKMIEALTLARPFGAECADAGVGHRSDRWGVSLMVTWPPWVTTPAAPSRRC